MKKNTPEIKRPNGPRGELKITGGNINEIGRRWPHGQMDNGVKSGGKSNDKKPNAPGIPVV